MTPEKMFKQMYGREPNDIELMQFKHFYRCKNVEKKLYGAAKRIQKKISPVCPVCDNPLNLPADVVVSEILSCKDCKTRVVVEARQPDGSARLAKAPDIEEDWGQ